MDLLNDKIKDYLIDRVERETGDRDWQYNLDQLIGEIADKIIRDYEQEHDEHFNSDIYESAMSFAEQLVKQRIRDYIK